MGVMLQFGYLPKKIHFTVDNVSIRTQDDLEQSVKEINESDLIERGWLYAPRARSKDMFSGKIRTLPYSARIFGLPKTHIIEHSTAVELIHPQFLIWALGFIYGIRLTESEAGYLDATPIETGKLHDIVWRGNSEQKALAIADKFWCQNIGEPRISKAITGIIHSLFLSQTPSLLCFEKFIYLYTALDACHYVQCLIVGKNPRKGTHGKRIANLCESVGCVVPDWADIHHGYIAACRNESLHEGLFFDEPLGFRIFGGNDPDSPSSNTNITLEMQALVCRLLCAILGFRDINYIGSDVNTRQRFGVKL